MFNQAVGAAEAGRPGNEAQLCSSMYGLRLAAFYLEGQQAAEAGHLSSSYLVTRMVFDLITTGRLDAAGWLTHTYVPSAYRRALTDLTSKAKARIIKAAFIHTP